MKYAVLSLAVLLACQAAPQGSREAPPAAAQAEAPPPAPAASPAETAAAPAALTLVSQVNQVCMVNNQFMGREQIPVVVEGKTYFGCCEMCKGRLANDPTARSAKDPITGTQVDKASAVIAKRDNGEVLYFESEQSFERYRAL